MNIRELLKDGVTIFDLPLRVTFYARVSTEHVEQATSIINQVDYFKKYIGDVRNWVYVDGYVDEGISGKNTFNRINFLRMIDDAKENKFDLVVTKSVSRFARNTVDSIQYTNLLFGCGIGVFFLNDNINTFYSDSEFRLTLMASIAQDEVRKLSESVQFGLHQSILRGVVLGNNNILGYHKIDGKLFIVDDEARVVRDVFSYFSIGKYHYSDVARMINFKYGLCFDSSRIKRILTNYKYKGFYCGRKSRIVDYKCNKRKYFEECDWVIFRDYDRVPPIVSESIWDKVHQIILSKNNNKYDCKYRDIVYCGRHMSRCYVKYKKYKSKIYEYLVCPGCFHLSTEFLNRIWNVCVYSKVLLFFDDGSLRKIVCQK